MASSKSTEIGDAPSWKTSAAFWLLLLFTTGAILGMLERAKIPQAVAAPIGLTFFGLAVFWRARRLQQKYGLVSQSIWLMRMVALLFFTAATANSALGIYVSEPVAASIGFALGLGAVCFFYFQRQSALSAQRKQQQSIEEANIKAREAEARLRAEAFWMDDPEDFRPLPKIPDFQRLPLDVKAEYIRKSDIRRKAGARVDREITEEKILHGTVYTSEQREVLIQRECRRLQALEDQAEVHAHQKKMGQQSERQDTQEIIEAIENSTQFGRSRRFKQDHPFLSGLMGDQNVDKLTSQGWWKG